MKAMHIRLAAFFAIGLCVPAVEAQDDEEEKGKKIDVGKVWKGDGSEIKEEECHRIVERDGWAALWTRHMGKKEKAPAVDFKKEMVVALFLPRRGCPPLTLSGVRQKKDLVEVLYGYSTGPAVRGYKTTAFLMFVMPRKKDKLVLKLSSRSFAHERNPPPARVRVLKEFDPLK